MKYSSILKPLRTAIAVGLPLTITGCSLPFADAGNQSFFNGRNQNESHNNVQGYSYAPYYGYTPVGLSHNLDSGQNYVVPNNDHNGPLGQNFGTSNLQVDNPPHPDHYTGHYYNAPVNKPNDRSRRYENNLQNYVPNAVQLRRSLALLPNMHASDASSLQQEIVSSYDAPKNFATTLPHSLESAYGASPRIAAEKLKIEEANEELIQVKSASRLKSELRGSLGGRQSDTIYNIVDRRDTSFRFGQSVEVDLSLPIYQGGRVKAQKESAKVRIKTAKANLDTVEGQVLQASAIAYLEVIRDRKLVSIYRQNVRMLEEQQRTAKTLLAQNESTVSDMALIDTRLAAIQISLEMAISELTSSESRYRTLVGSTAPKLLPVPTLQLPISLYEVKMIAKENNPEIRSIQTQAESAIHDVNFAKSSSKPTLALQGILRGSRGQTESIDRNTAAEILLNFRVPLLSGGENKSKVRQAELAKSRIALEIYSATQSLNENAELLWANLQAAKRNNVLNRKQIEAAEQAHHSISRQREAGLATTLDMFAIEQTLLDARLNSVRAEYREMSTRIQLLNLMGRLHQTFILPNSF